MRSRTALVVAGIMVLMAPLTSRADDATKKALQDWYRGVGPLPDLIARQDGMNQVIAPPLTSEELQTMREALWKREANNIQTDTERGWRTNKIWELTVFQQMAFAHLLNGGALRAGDFTALDPPFVDRVTAEHLCVGEKVATPDGLRRLEQGAGMLSSRLLSWTVLSTRYFLRDGCPRKPAIDLA